MRRLPVLAGLAGLGIFSASGCGDLGSEEPAPDLDPKRDRGFDRTGPSPEGGSGPDPRSEPDPPAGGGCLAIDQEEIDFGLSPVGGSAVASLVLQNCGAIDVRITALSFGGEVSAFLLDCSLMTAGHCPTPDAPLTLTAGGKAIVRVHFEPKSTGGPDLTKLETAELVVKSDAAEPALSVGLAGEAVGPACPLPRIHVSEGEVVAPVTTLHLSGGESSSPGGAVVSYSWAVQAPSGPATWFFPNALEEDVTVEVSLAGTYVFSLSIVDETGKSSCASAEAEVLVRPEDGIHVELTWATPGDQAPQVGTDVDLHLLHPLAEGLDRDGDGEGDGWFHMPWDCFWFNRTPVWDEASGGHGDPELLRDDVFGDGPEVIRIAEPQEGATYRVGVHFWKENQFASTTARLRVWIDGEKVSEVGNVTLLEDDLWYAARIHWPSGVVEVPQSDSSFDVTPDYPMPEAFLP